MHAFVFRSSMWILGVASMLLPNFLVSRLRRVSRTSEFALRVSFVQDRYPKGTTHSGRGKDCLSKFELRRDRLRLCNCSLAVKMSMLMVKSFFMRRMWWVYTSPRFLEARDARVFVHMCICYDHPRLNAMQSPTIVRARPFFTRLEDVFSDRSFVFNALRRGTA